MEHKANWELYSGLGSIWAIDQDGMVHWPPVGGTWLRPLWVECNGSPLERAKFMIFMISWQVPCVKKTTLQLWILVQFHYLAHSHLRLLKKETGPAHTMACSSTVNNPCSAHSAGKAAFASKNKVHGAQQHMVPIEHFDKSVCQQKLPRIHGRVPKNWAHVCRGIQLHSFTGISFIWPNMRPDGSTSCDKQRSVAAHILFNKLGSKRQRPDGVLVTVTWPEDVWTKSLQGTRMFLLVVSFWVPHRAEELVVWLYSCQRKQRLNTNQPFRLKQPYSEPTLLYCTVRTKHRTCAHTAGADLHMQNWLAAYRRCPVCPSEGSASTNITQRPPGSLFYPKPPHDPHTFVWINSEWVFMDTLLRHIPRDALPGRHIKPWLTDAKLI